MRGGEGEGKRGNDGRGVSKRKRVRVGRGRGMRDGGCTFTHPMSSKVIQRWFLK